MAERADTGVLTGVRTIRLMTDHSPFDAASYLEMIRADVPEFDALQSQVAATDRLDVRSVLDLGVGTGATAAAAAVLDVHPSASVIGVDERADLFRRVAVALRWGGRFVFGDVVIPERPEDAVAPIQDPSDQPSSLSEQLEWLTEAGLRSSVVWNRGTWPWWLGTGRSTSERSTATRRKSPGAVTDSVRPSRAPSGEGH